MVYIFYHRIDLDGFASGALTRYYFEQLGKTTKMVPINYGEPVDWSKFTDKDEIYFVDFHLHKEDFDKLLKYNIVIIDHHESFLEEINQKFNGVVKVGEAACSLVWKYFYGPHVPEAIWLLSEYDVWHNDNKQLWNSRILPFQYGMRSLDLDPYGSGFETWKNIMDKLDDREWINSIVHKGQAILDYLKFNSSMLLKAYSFEAEFEGYKALCLNTAEKGSQQFETLWDESKYDLMLRFVRLKDRYEVSLYTTKNIDVSKLAAKYGGGGHVNAAGFPAFNMILTDNRINFN